MKKVERNETIMKKYISIRSRKKTRGVAVIFTLGILGLLTVMALGFASTALLNRKIADNTSSAEYARHIAKNIAFARARSVVLNNFIANSAYNSGPTSGVSDEDFLHKMDTVLDGVELYRITNDSGTIQPGTARWQYVYGPEQNPVSHKYPIIGRYAFAIVPVTGRLDPAGNTGSTSVSGRYGFSEKELGFYNLVSDPKLATDAVSAGGVRLRTFKEFVSAFSNLSADSKKNLLNANYRIQLDSTPEAFWIDVNDDGKKTEDELYLRFNMPTTDSDWNDMTVEKLIGEEGGSDADADIKYPTDSASTKTSIPFIPWLKYWEHEVNSEWTNDIVRKQIAANIIQYNRPKPNALDSGGDPIPTVSDQSGDWLTNDAPKYAGIGRHPMLNEIGFSVTVKGDVTSENIGTPEEPNYKYTPRYEITVESGAELICPFFNPASSSDINKAFVKFAGEIIIKLRKFKSQSDINSITSFSDALDEIVTDAATEPWTFSTKTAISKLTDGGTPAVDGGSWASVDLNIEIPANSDHWNSSPAYTKAGTFWNLKTQQTVTLPPFTLPVSSGLSGTDQSAKIKEWLDLQHVDYKPGKTVLLYGDAPTDMTDTRYPKFQRDFANLPDKAETSTQKVGKKKWIYFVSYEAKDPLVNHYSSDWTPKTFTLEYPTSGSAEEIAKEVNKAYPGTVFDEEGGTVDNNHKNSTVSATLLTDNENGASVTLESATDPAWTSEKRLSSSYIRHAPMKSFWELGFISRAEAFKTLNLARTRVFAPGTDYKNRGGGTFAQGDANILDQIKFSDPTDRKYARGKINLNARYHKVFEWLFNKDQVTAEGTAVNWYHNLITGTASDPFETLAPFTGDTRKVVCENENCLSVQHSASCSVNDCLAHLLMERSRILPFSNRSDLLLDPKAENFDKIPGYDNLSSTAQSTLEAIQQKIRNYLLDPFHQTPDSDDAKSKLVREEYATRFMNLLSAEENDLEHVYIIVLAQAIKDIGGAPALVDWDGDGEYKSSGSVSLSGSANFLKTGFVRRKLGGTDYETITTSTGTAPDLTETKTTTEVGTYDYGADKITGETKLIVEMRRDGVGKWKVIGYRYVE